MTLDRESRHGQNRLAGDRLRTLHLIDDRQGGVAKDAAQSLHREGIGRLERSLERPRRLGLDLLGIFDEGFEAGGAHAAPLSSRAHMPPMAPNTLAK